MPATCPLADRTRSTPSSTVARQGPIVATKLVPASVRATLRVGADEERLTQPGPQPPSTAWLTADGLIFSAGLRRRQNRPVLLRPIPQGSGEQIAVHSCIISNGYVDLNHLVGRVGFRHHVASGSAGTPETIEEIIL